MAKKKPQPEDEPVPATESAAPTKPERKKRTDDGKERDRKIISLPAELYDRLQTLADRNDRPIYWEARRIILKALEAEGL